MNFTKELLELSTAQDVKILEGINVPTAFTGKAKSAYTTGYLHGFKQQKKIDANKVYGEHTDAYEDGFMDGEAARSSGSSKSERRSSKDREAAFTEDTQVSKWDSSLATKNAYKMGFKHGLAGDNPIGTENFLMSDHKKAYEDGYRHGKMELDFKKPVKESEELKKVADDRRTADKMEEGDKVVITGAVNYKDQEGKIVRFGKDKHFVIVKLHNGGEHSFQSSDVSELEVSKQDDEDEVEAFYVAFYDQNEQRSWIGLVTKEHGGKWHEESFKGKPEGRWGQSYASHLEPEDVMRWIHKDYPRSMEIEGPFFDESDAEEYVKENWGRIDESLRETAEHAVNTLTSMLTKTNHNVIITSNKRGVGLIHTIKHSIPGITVMVVNENTNPLQLAKQIEEVKGHPILFDLSGTRTDISPNLQHVLNGAASGHVKYVSTSAFGSNGTVETKVGRVIFVRPSDVRLGGGNNCLAMNYDTLIAQESIEQVKEDAGEMKPWDILSALSHKRHGEPDFDSLSHDQVSKYVDLPAANKHANKDYGIPNFLELPASRQRHIINKHPEFLAGLAAKAFKNPKSLEELDEEVYTGYADWKQAVLLSNPAQATKIRFRGKMEGEKTTITAVVPGEERVYGFWDDVVEKGKVISEGNFNVIGPDDELIEGGFFSKEAAERCADSWNKAWEKEAKSRGLSFSSKDKATVKASKSKV